MDELKLSDLRVVRWCLLGEPLPVILQDPEEQEDGTWEVIVPVYRPDGSFLVNPDGKLNCRKLRGRLEFRELTAAEVPAVLRVARYPTELMDGSVLQETPSRERESDLEPPYCRACGSYQVRCRNCRRRIAPFGGLCIHVGTFVHDDDPDGGPSHPAPVSSFFCSQGCYDETLNRSGEWSALAGTEGDSDG